MRPAINARVDSLVDIIAHLTNGDDKLLKGVMNYTITTLLNEVYEKDSYSNFNDIIGIVENVKLEFYRRRTASYEDLKIFENGDCYPNPIEVEINRVTRGIDE